MYNTPLWSRLGQILPGIRGQAPANTVWPRLLSSVHRRSTCRDTLINARRECKALPSVMHLHTCLLDWCTRSPPQVAGTEVRSWYLLPPLPVYLVWSVSQSLAGVPSSAYPTSLAHPCLTIHSAELTVIKTQCLPLYPQSVHSWTPGEHRPNMHLWLLRSTVKQTWSCRQLGVSPLRWRAAQLPPLRLLLLSSSAPLHYGGGAEVRGLFNPKIRLLQVLALPGRIQPRIFFLTSRFRLKATRPLRSISSLSLFKDDARRSRQHLQSDLDRWSSCMSSVGFYKQQLYCRQKISSRVIAMFRYLHSVTIICSSAVILLPGEHIALAYALRSLLRHLRPLALRSGSQANSTNCVAFYTLRLPQARLCHLPAVLSSEGYRLTRISWLLSLFSQPLPGWLLAPQTNPCHPPVQWIRPRSVLRTRTRQPPGRTGVCQTHQALNLKALYYMRRRWPNRHSGAGDWKPPRPDPLRLQQHQLSRYHRNITLHLIEAGALEDSQLCWCRLPFPLLPQTTLYPVACAVGSSETASVTPCIRLQLTLKTSESFL